MSTAGWIFLVGTRVIDLGGMIIWLVWFFRHRDEPDDDWDWRGWDDGRRQPPPSPNDPDGGGLRLPLPDADPWPTRVRDHTAQRPARTERRPLPVHHDAPPQREREPS